MSLRDEVCAANKLLPEYGLVKFTWGNVSGVDRERGVVVIKPSGVSFAELTAENMVEVDFEGRVLTEGFKPSSDTPTHIELYKAFPEISGIVHTHSVFATSFAQAGLAIPALGTTHADFAFGEIPCADMLTKHEVDHEYEANTGRVIAAFFAERGIDYRAVPAVLARAHGPFAWGLSPMKAVENAAVLEIVAEMAYRTLSLEGGVSEVPKYLLKKHYERKHGDKAYYGQERQL